MNVSDDSNRVQGSVEVTRILDKDGNPMRMGSIYPGSLDDPQAIPSPEFPQSLGDNLVVNLGRTVIARLLGGLGGPSDVISRVSFGTGSEAPRYDDATLSPQRGGVFDGGENQLEISTGVTKKGFSGVDFPGSYLVRFAFAIDYNECNGFIIREAGLWTLGNTLFARKTFPGIMKSGDQRVEMAWTIRA